MTALLLALAALLFPEAALADGFNVQTAVPGPVDINRYGILGYVQNAYLLALAAAGGLAVASIVWGAVQYAGSRGNPSKLSDAWDRIVQALVGLLLLVGAATLLSVVNPGLLSLELPKLEPTGAKFESQSYTFQPHEGEPSKPEPQTVTDPSTNAPPQNPPENPPAISPAPIPTATTPTPPATIPSSSGGSPQPPRRVAAKAGNCYTPDELRNNTRILTCATGWRTTVGAANLCSRRGRQPNETYYFCRQAAKTNSCWEFWYTSNNVVSCSGNWVRLAATNEQGQLIWHPLKASCVEWMSRGGQLPSNNSPLAWSICTPPGR